MPDRKTTEKAHAAKRAGKAPSTQAGAFVKDEVERVRHGEHGVRSAKQAVAIGLSKARRAGVDVKPPKPGTTSAATRRKAGQDSAVGHGEKSHGTESKAKRSRTTTAVLKRESKAGASKQALSKQTRSAAAKRPAASRSAASKKGAATKGAAGRSAAAKKAAQTRAARAHHH